MRSVLVVAVLAWVATSAGCAGPCAEIAARQRTLRERRDAAPGPHARVVVPFAVANRLLAELVREPELRVPLALPELGLAIGGRRFEARVVGAVVSDDDLAFRFDFAAVP